MARAYIGIGSNLDDRQKNIETALNYFKEEGIKLLRVSSIIETEPEENLEQPKFLNAVCEAETNHTPLDLLHKLAKIEYRLGRPRKREKNSPRTMDLDILLFDDLLIKGKTLIIPHPKMHRRHFVLKGLHELIPELMVPGHQKTIVQLINELNNTLVCYGNSSALGSNCVTARSASDEAVF